MDEIKRLTKQVDNPARRVIWLEDLVSKVAALVEAVEVMRIGDLGSCTVISMEARAPYHLTSSGSSKPRYRRGLLSKGQGVK